MKVVLAVTLEVGQDDVESAQFTVSSVTDEDDDDVSLVKPWRVTWTKSATYWRYPISYVQDVNNKPTETIIKTGWLECSASSADTAEEVTCGVATVDGKRVKNSEGFCCGCDLEDIKSGAETRGNLKCSALSMEESAHCLGWDELWYSVLSVDNPTVFYDIEVSISRPTSTTSSWANTTYAEEVITVSHSVPTGKSSDGSVIVKLVGDFATATAPHSFESKYLVIPSRPTGHARVDADYPLRYAMLLETSLFELSGLTCDKIGVSYTAFATQANMCDIAAGSCLANQLDDYHEEDQERSDAGTSTRYFVESFCDGAMELGAQSDELEGTTRFLGCPMTSRHTSVMTITVAADSASFVTNVATGEIVSVSSTEFEALQGGSVTVSVVSTGSVKAAFTISVTNCSGGLTADPAVEVSIAPYQVYVETFAVYASQTAGGSFACTALLYGATADLLDMQEIGVNVSDTVINNGAQSGNNGADGDEATDSDSDGGTCDSTCPSFFDVICFLAHSCWEKFARMGVGLAIIFALVCCCWKGTRSGLWCKLVGKLCKAPKSRSGRGSQKIEVKVDMPRHAEQPYFWPAASPGAKLQMQPQQMPNGDWQAVTPQLQSPPGKGGKGQWGAKGSEGKASGKGESKGGGGKGFDSKGGGGKDGKKGGSKGFGGPMGKGWGGKKGQT